MRNKFMTATAVAAFAFSLTGGLTGCSSGGGTPPAVTQPGPQSPDVSAKDPTKAPAPAGSSNAMPGKSAPASSGQAGPLSPDVAAKDPSKPPAPKTAEPGAVMGPKFKDATHTLASDQPYYSGNPNSGKPSDGVWKAGTPVLVLVPGASFSMVKTGNDKTGYVQTSALQPLGK